MMYLDEENSIVYQVFKLRAGTYAIASKPESELFWAPDSKFDLMPSRRKAEEALAKYGEEHDWKAVKKRER